MDWLIAFFADIFFDGICEGWFWLMQWIVPTDLENKVFRRVLKILIGIFSIVVLLILLAGAVYMTSNDSHTVKIGTYMFVGALFVSIMQISAGILFRNKNKKNRL